MPKDDIMPALTTEAIARATDEVSASALVISSPAGIGYVNRAFERLTGFSRVELAGRSLTSLAHPDSRPELEDQLRDQFSGFRRADARDVRLVDKAGQVVATEHRSDVIEDGGLVLVVSTFVDARARLELESALAVTKAHGQQLFDEDPNGRFVARPDGGIVDCNSALAQMLGVEAPDRIVGRHVWDVLPDLDTWAQVTAAVTADGMVGPLEVQIERPDGDTIQVAVRFHGGFDDQRRLASVRALLVEVTESRRLQIRLLGALRMEAIGRLAGGLAHDFNNLLMVIGGHAERLSEGLTTPGPLRTSALVIQQATERATSLTRQLLAFSRRQVFELQPVAMHQMLADARPLLAKVLGEHIRLELDVPSDMPAVRADPAQLEQVFVNLALNAREAMPSGGALTIRGSLLEVGIRPPKERPWLRTGRYARMEVADTGQGMDPKTQAHVFEPFFTTKQMGHGTGLGLATVYGIVKQSDGYVWVESAVGSGTRFTLLLPLLDEASATHTAGH